jgi:succinyl-CoA synthetase beta subunit
LPASGHLNEAESKQLFARFGIPSTREFVVASPAEAEVAVQKLGGRAVLKILSRHIAHKTEVGGIRVDVPVHEIARHCAEMTAAVAAKSPHALEGFLVQELIRDGVELILGFHRDPQLGAAVLLGVGGIATELFNDTTLRLLPVTHDDAQDMIANLRSAPLLRGFRGRPRYDVDALARAIVAFSDMALALGPRLAEAEINPLFVLPEGRGVRAGDGLVMLRDA